MLSCLMQSKGEWNTPHPSVKISPRMEQINLLNLDKLLSFTCILQIDPLRSMALQSVFCLYNCAFICKNLIQIKPF
jgi:hypothetical protein